ncbi:MAG: glycosyltransferase [Clostridia bacterium]|nr:glycosyltransferase [Clostridia bacterium]
MEPTLSIIVPVYNVGSFLSTCIDSILAQTFTDFELILVDDGSTDGSEKICDEYARKDNRIKVIHKENNGVVSARKTGLLAAKGKYAGYVDGDDFIEPDMYEKMVFYMQKHDCDLVMCDVEHENKALPLSSGGIRIDIDGGFYDRQGLCEKLFPNMIYAGEFYNFGIYPVIWNKLYKREKLIDFQLAVDENIRTGEDAACVYPYVWSSDSLYFMKNMSLYHYRHSQNQMTKSYDAKHFERFKALYNFFQQTDIASSSYAYQLDYYYSYLIKTAVSSELNKTNKIPFKEKLTHIKEISSFALEAGFLHRIKISSPMHRFYFYLLKKNRPLPIVAGIYITRFIQKISG